MAPWKRWYVAVLHVLWHLSMINQGRFRTYTLKSKDKISSNSFKLQLKFIQIDNRREYTRPSNKYCKQQDIWYQKIPLKIPQLNNLTERMNRTLVERIKSLLFHAKLSKSFWDEPLNIISLMFLTGYGPTRMFHIITCMSLVAMLLYMYLKIRSQNLTLRLDSVCFWAMDRINPLQVIWSS